LGKYSYGELRSCMAVFLDRVDGLGKRIMEGGDIENKNKL